MSFFLLAWLGNLTYANTVTNRACIGIDDDGRDGRCGIIHNVGVAVSYEDIRS